MLSFSFFSFPKSTSANIGLEITSHRKLLCLTNVFIYQFINLLHSELLKRNTNMNFHFYYFISLIWDGPGSWNLSIWNTGTYPYNVVSIMAISGTRSSAAMILTYFAWNDPGSYNKGWLWQGYKLLSFCIWIINIACHMNHSMKIDIQWCVVITSSVSRMYSQ